jgi:hypothetical protein
MQTFLDFFLELLDTGENADFFDFFLNFLVGMWF